MAGIETKRRCLWGSTRSKCPLGAAPSGCPLQRGVSSSACGSPGGKSREGMWLARKEADRPRNRVLSWACTLPGGDPRAPLPAQRHWPEHQMLPTGSASLFTVPLGFCWSCGASHGDSRESTLQGSPRVSPHLRGQRRRCAPSPGGPRKLAAQALGAHHAQAPGACGQTGGSAAWLVGKAREGQGWSQNG